MVATSQPFILDFLPAHASGQVHRVCERFALIAAGGEMASQYGITQWPVGEAHQAARQCFQDWVIQRGSVENQERTHILSQVRKFFEAHGESRFTEWEAQNSRTINRAGFKKTHPQNTSTIYYVMPEIFRQEICAGLDHRRVTHTLLTEGWLQPDTHHTPYRREQLPGIGRARCYVFTDKLWAS